MKFSGLVAPDGKVYFHWIFVALDTCLKGFLHGCRPHLGFDACHLKGKYKGVLAAATRIDGNKYMLSVAFAVMESENANSWQWFLRNLKLRIGETEGLTILSNRQKRLDKVLARVYHEKEYRKLMLRHLYTNFKRKIWGQNLQH